MTMVIIRFKANAIPATARASWPERRLVMIYQPHRYTRTRDLCDDFIAGTLADCCC